MRARACATLIGAALVGGFAAATPATAAFIAVAEDPVGDSADPDPGRDIVGVALSYDRRVGELRGGVRLAGTPNDEAPANLTLFAGRRTATGCNAYPAIGFGTRTDVTTADWVRLRAAGAEPAAVGAASKDYKGAAEEYAATSPRLAGVRPNCVVAQLNEPGNPGVVYDVAGPYPLRGLPELEAQLVNLPKAMRPGHTRTARLILRNPGDAPTGRVKIGVAGVRGVGVRLTTPRVALRAGQRRVVPVRITMTARARSTTDLRVTAVGNGGLRAQATGQIELRRPASPPDEGGGSSGGGGGDQGTKLCFRYTWMPPYSELVVC